MSRLRHPIRAAREPFGKAGLIVAIVALVAAIGGTAFAAAGSTRSRRRKSNRSPRSSPASGANGKNGTNGANGAPGAKGHSGAAGKNGTNGTSVTTVVIKPGEAKCNKQGGVEVKSASPTAEVCNGTTGFTETLPKGQTETGQWSIVALHGCGIRRIRSCRRHGVRSPFLSANGLRKEQEAIRLRRTGRRRKANQKKAKWSKATNAAAPAKNPPPLPESSAFSRAAKENVFLTRVVDLSQAVQPGNRSQHHRVWHRSCLRRKRADERARLLGGDRRIARFT